MNKAILVIVAFGFAGYISAQMVEDRPAPGVMCLDANTPVFAKDKARECGAVGKTVNAIQARNAVLADL